MGRGVKVRRAKVVQVSCAETITSDATLDSDLVGCPSNGIVIGADNVTLDLNGHTIAGNGDAHLGSSPRAMKGNQ
jgi:hypothetical protein